MKRSSKVLYAVLMALPLAVTLIVLGFLPGQVPAHYGPDFQVDRWGSKYELLLLPGFTVLMGLLLLFFGRLAARQEGTGQNNAKVAVTAGLLCMALFNALTYYFLYTAWAQVTDLSALPVRVEQVAFGCMGALLLVVGNLNPKLRNNGLMGLRTPWSRKNDRVWKKCQRFGGISLMLAGAPGAGGPLHPGLPLPGAVPGGADPGGGGGCALLLPGRQSRRGPLPEETIIYIILCDFSDTPTAE